MGNSSSDLDRKTFARWRDVAGFNHPLPGVKIEGIGSTEEAAIVELERKCAKKQYAKVYKRHLDEEGNPSEKYWIWAKTGWNNPRAVRYPAGKGAMPEYSFWNNNKYGYVEARKRIYAPTYAALVTETDAYKRLEEIVTSGRYKEVWFRDFDGYDYTSLGYSLQDVINDEKHKMGHAFVLVMCLLDQKVWE